MPSLTFKLLPPSISRLHEALTCLAKFDETVYLEAFPSYLSLSTINTSKTAYANFKFDASSTSTSTAASTGFFEEYGYDATGFSDGGKGCLFLNKV